MIDAIIGRAAEQDILRQRINSDFSELIAIYGRRRGNNCFGTRGQDEACRMP